MYKPIARCQEFVQPRPVSFAAAGVGSESASSPRLRPTRDICYAQTPQTNSTSLKTVFAAAEMETVVDISRNAQRRAFARRFAPGLLQPFTGLTLPVRIGEMAQTALSRWSISPQPAKPISKFRYLAACDRAHWLMLRESLFSLYRSWNSLPEIFVVSDGSWDTDEFAGVFGWWPTPITVLTRQDVCLACSRAGFSELAEYAGQSIYGLCLAAKITQAMQQPMLFVDADVLWVKDPALLLGDPASWVKPRAVRDNYCYQRRDLALRYCAKVLEPPFVNAGIVALHGELMAPGLLRGMVQEALRNPQDSSCEQTIIATAIKLGGEFFPEQLSLIAIDDTYSFFIRNAKQEGYYSRHYVTPARQLLYRDALKIRLSREKLEALAADRA
jgi:hypothetical protein